MSGGNMDRIVRIQLGRVDRLPADRRMAIALDGSAQAWLADRGYDRVYGARPLKRVIQKELINPREKLLAGSSPTDLRCARSRQDMAHKGSRL